MRAETSTDYVSFPQLDGFTGTIYADIFFIESKVHLNFVWFMRGQTIRLRGGPLKLSLLHSWLLSTSISPMNVYRRTCYRVNLPKWTKKKLLDVHLGDPQLRRSWWDNLNLPYVWSSSMLNTSDRQIRYFHVKQSWCLSGKDIRCVKNNPFRRDQLCI